MAENLVVYTVVHQPRRLRLPAQVIPAGTQPDDLPRFIFDEEMDRRYFEQVARASDDGKAAANWVLGEVLAALKTTSQSIAHFTVRPADLGALIVLVRDGVVSHSAAKQIFAIMVRTGDVPMRIAERESLLKVTDDAAIGRWVDEVLAEHPAEAGRYMGGEHRLQGVLVGHVMKKSNGRADPKRANQLLWERAGAPK